jgi:hypothetical protein
MTSVKAFLAQKARRAAAFATVTVGGLIAAPSAMASGTSTTISGLSVPTVKMITPPGASDVQQVLGYLLWAGCAACLGGLIFYVMKMVTAHWFGRQASEHNGILGSCIAGAVILGVGGSALNGLL